MRHGPGRRRGRRPRSLGQLLYDVRHLPDIDLVVLSGDVADDGSVEGYRDALALVGHFAASRGVPTVYAAGDHDDRTAFAAVLGSGHLDAAGRDAGRLMPGTSARRAAVSHVAGYRVISLDSLVPGAVHGRLGLEQLGWLSEVLATAYGEGSVVVLHHPPIALAGTVQQEVGLQDPEGLAAALEGSDVHVVLCGHFHLQLSGRLGRTPVWVGPGVLTRIDLTAPPWMERAVRGATATVVDLGRQGSPLFHTLHARDRRAGEQVSLVDAASGQCVQVESVQRPVLGHDAEARLVVGRAEEGDAAPLLALREAAAAWLAGRGIRQWEPGEVSLQDVRRQVESGEWHVLREQGTPVAALRLLWQDDIVWGQQPPVAAYVHGLVVAGQHRGAGLGRFLLEWAGGEAREHGRSLLRLDCGEDNQALRRYDAAQGFQVAGRRDAGKAWYAVVLLEQQL